MFTIQLGLTVGGCSYRNASGQIYRIVLFGTLLDDIDIGNTEIEISAASITIRQLKSFTPETCLDGAPTIPREKIRAKNHFCRNAMVILSGLLNRLVWRDVRTEGDGSIGQSGFLNQS
jgi:hypothetical protein